MRAPLMLVAALAVAVVVASAGALVTQPVAATEYCFPQPGSWRIMADLIS